MTDSPPPAADPQAHPLAFTPVATASRRHDGWTPDRQRKFMAALAVSGGVGGAAKSVGMSPTSAYNLRKRQGAESFAAAWDAALEQGRERAFQIVCDRALNGVTTPRFYRGRFVGMRHRYDYRGIMAALMPPAPPAGRGK